MLYNYIEYMIYGLYIVGGLSLIVSILTYIYLPQALNMIFEDDSKDNKDS
jgi:hypothetical protein